MRRRKSIFDEFTDQQLQEIINLSKNYSEVLQRVGLSTKSGNFQTLHKKVLERNLSYSRLYENRAGALIKNARSSAEKSKIPINEILVDDSTYTCTSHLKSRIIAEGLLPYRCSECGITSWNGKEIVLQIDHINGKRNDNRISNLRLLCPNCHSQTKTYAGKNRR